MADNNVKKRRGQFKAGNPGRPKGSANHLTKTVKETVLKVFNELQTDPETSLTAFAEKYPRDFYAIAAKLIPTEISGKIDNEIKLTIVRGKNTT